MHHVESLRVGGLADSGHEYLLKQYLQTGKSDKTLLEMCTLPSLFLSLRPLIPA